jgi:hypothetical protein
VAVFPVLAINLRYRRGMLHPGSVVTTSRWHKCRERLSPRFTTEFDEMLAAKE